MKRLGLLLALTTLLSGADLMIPGTDLPLPVPNGWRAVVDPGTVLALEAPDRRLRLAVSTRVLQDGEGPAAFAQRCLADVQRLLPGVVLEDWMFAETRAGRSWSRLRYRFHLGEADYRQVQWITISGTTGICISLGGAPGHDPLPQATSLEQDLWGSRPILTR